MIFFSSHIHTTEYTLRRTVLGETFYILRCRKLYCITKYDFANKRPQNLGTLQELQPQAVRCEAISTPFPFSGRRCFPESHESFTYLRKRGSHFLGRRRFYMISLLLLLKQISLLKTKITQCRVSLAVQSQLSRSESPYRADVSQFSYFAGKSFDSVPPLCSNLL